LIIQGLHHNVGQMRAVVRAVGRVALGGLAMVGAEAAYAVVRPGPRLEEFDASGTFGDPSSPPLKMAVLGDSSCTGIGVETADEIWSRLVAYRLAERFLVTMTSLAKGGSRASDLISNQLEIACRLAPDLVFVSVGANDVLKGVPIPVFERNLDQVIGELSAVCGLVVQSGVGDLGTIPRLLPPLDRMISLRGIRADRAHQRVADRYGSLKVDMRGLTSHQFRTNPDIFSVDLLHPTAVGHRVWAEAAWVTIEPHLSRLASAIN
jgi:lysophospholipase L1-like esterase